MAKKETVVGVLATRSGGGENNDVSLRLALVPWLRGGEVRADKELLICLRTTESKFRALMGSFEDGRAYRAVVEGAVEDGSYVRVFAKRRPTVTELPPELAAAARPVVVKDATLGRMVLDRGLQYFHGRTALWGKRVRVEIDGIDPDVIPGVAKHFARHASAKARATHEQAIVATLLKQANDWSNKPLTAKQLVATLVPESISLGSDGSATIYWRCGRIFHGHGIMTDMTKTGRVKRAEMC
jgi:hypothetical protein